MLSIHDRARSRSVTALLISGQRTVRRVNPWSSSNLEV
jgi:hypothetical protein